MVSILLSTTISAFRRARRHRPPARRGWSCRPCRRSPPAPSIRCSSTRARSTWPRKRSPMPAPSLRAFDQAGNVGQHEVALVDADDAEIGMERGEGIVGDLRLGGRDGGEEGRLAGIGQADEAGIGDQLQPQPDPLSCAVQAGIGVARRLVGRGLEMGIAEAAIAACASTNALADFGEVGRSASRCRLRRPACRPALSASTSAPLAPVRFLPMPWVPVLALKCCW